MKFVIHLHETARMHYDLMIERDGFLETYRINAGDMNTFISGILIRAEKIKDHRKEYLSYEGPVSCDRGSVRMFDEGEYRCSSKNHEKEVLILEGNLFRGTVALWSAGDDRFFIQYEKKP